MDEHESFANSAKFARFAKLYKVIALETRQLKSWRGNCSLFFTLPAVPAESKGETVHPISHFFTFV